MARLRRPLAAVLVVAGASAALAVLLAHSSTNSSSAAPRAATSRMAHESLLEQGRGDDAGGENSDAYTDRAYPGTEITAAEIQGAMSANAQLKRRGPKLSSKWDSIGPDTLDVDRLGTQSFIKPTQWSGRITALAVDPKCKPQECTVYVGAAGGGVWRTTNALAPTPSWKQISEGIPTNAIGSIAVDPNDQTGQTIYVGTGEGNASGDSEAGLGLYKTTDGGSHWPLVDGSFAVTNNRSITWIAIEPGSPKHIVLGTRNGTRGEGSNSTSVAPVAVPATGVYNSTDGGASFALTLPGLINEVKFDPSDANTVYATLANSATGGLLRSTTGGAGGWQPIFQENRGRFTFAPVSLPNGKTRIYLGDANGGGQGAQVYRVDDASQPAAALTASNNAAWTRLSNPVDGTPGFAVYNYCASAFGPQCAYDMFIMSPPDRPDTVVVGGLMHYEELKPYVHQVAQVVGQRSNGRAVLMSTDAGATWNDMTGDVGGESMHPDQHVGAFVPGNPDQFFVGSDGGLIRTNGKWADASDQCDHRDLAGLNPAYITECKQWLSRIPEKLEVMNAGLATLQMYSISVSPYSPDDTAMTGTQDNGTLSFTGSQRWFLPLTGDGCDSGFDATDPHLRFHTYTNGIVDVNYNDADPTTWLWIGDLWYLSPPEPTRFCAPVVSDTVRTKTIFIGAQSVWRTTNAGGDRAFLEQHCNTAVGEEPSDLLYTGACGTAADWLKLGTSTLTNGAATSPYGTTKGGSTISSLSRGVDDGTMWAGTGGGRVLISKNIDAAVPASVTFTRIDTASQPNRAVSSIFADPTNPNHAIVTFSGYDVATAATPGHVFDVVFDPAAGTASWTNISFDLGDQPINDAVLDVATGNIYVSTDFGVAMLEHGTETWAPAADGLPLAAVSGLTIADAEHGPGRWIYAATHGRGAYRIRVR